MSNPSSGRIHALCVLCATLSVSALACSKKPPTPAVKAAAEAAETPQAHVVAQGHVIQAMRRATSQGMSALHRELVRRDEALPVTRPPLADAERITLLFGGNAHGEAFDCGCKANPLGGLARRATLVSLATAAPSDEARQRWGPPLVPGAPRAWAHVDGGDALFPSSAAGQTSDATRQRLMRDAEAVIAGLAAQPLDAFAVGELDLALGWPAVERLRQKAPNLPMLSANLRDAQSRPLLPGHRIIKRGGKTIALIALTKDRPRQLSYYADRKLRVQPAREAYAAEVAKLPADIDAIVLLSTLGMTRTQDLVREIHAEGKRVDAVIVSNSNRLTRKPVWVEGVPLVEPLSQGKYFGRLDLFRRGAAKQWRFLNGRAPLWEPLDDFRRHLKGYWDTRATVNMNLQNLSRARRELQEATGELAKQEAFWKTRATSDAQRKIRDAELKQLTSRIDDLKRRESAHANHLQINQRRVGVISTTLADDSATLAARLSPAPASDAQDWAEVTIVPVKLDIPEAPAVKQAVGTQQD